MLTVPEAARRVRKNPETVRRWIREGKLRSRKVGTQHVIEEADLDAFAGGTPPAKMLPLPRELRRMADGRPMPNVVEWLKRSREGR